MTAHDDPFDLPEDHYLAFLQIERELRGRLQIRLDSAEDNSPWFEWYQDYANGVLGAAQGLDIEELSHLMVPADRNNYHDEYRKIVLAVDKLTIQVKIAYSRQNKRFSVALDAAAKTKIRHHLMQLKEFIDKLDVSQRKREAIISKIIALEEELERARTKFEVVGALVLDVASIAGEAGDRLEPWRKWLDPIARIMGLAKDGEPTTPALPASSERKKIAPPKTPSPPPIDDDIPF
jgi:hypothetical protein